LGGVQFAQVAVDTETGKVTVEKVVAVHDCGRPMNPLTTKSQINGGVIQGLSYALFENRILDPNTGLMVNPNLEQYKIAGAVDMPEIEPILIEQYWGKSSTDAAGIGEPSTVPTAGAIANAVYNAIGVRIRQIPMTPAVVLAALAEKNEKKGA
jgi:xanthine dehydrogenase YagR molybdenum-binding subunit